MLTANDTYNLLASIDATLVPLVQLQASMILLLFVECLLQEKKLDEEGESGKLVR